jgi:release factor glutamine methyltransferase
MSVLADIETTLSKVYEDPVLREQSARWILEAITKKKIAQLIAQDTIQLSEQQQATLTSWLDRIVNEHMPLQYLLGSVPFCNLDILVEPPILIPRPETEEWTTWLIEQLRPLKHTKLQILDICSGSGCISLALAQALPHATVIAVALGRKNAAHNKTANITFVQSDLFNEVVSDKLFDLVVSNPPYISFAEFENLDTSVTTWEDPQALVAEDEGLAILRAIIEQAPDFLKFNQEMFDKHIPQVVLEIDYDQGHKVAQSMQENGYTDVTVHKDLEGKDRWVTGRALNVANNEPR